MTPLEIYLLSTEDRKELCQAIVDCINQMMMEMELAELEDKLVEPECEKPHPRSPCYLKNDLGENFSRAEVRYNN